MTALGREVRPDMRVAEAQPYARHWLHSLGLGDEHLVPEMWDSVAYMLWNGLQWKVFRAELGGDPEKIRASTHGDVFLAWLADRCGCAS